MTAAAFACTAVVTDIEGTTGSISFVRDVLFPYAQVHLADFLARRRDDAGVAQALRETAVAANEPGADEPRIVEILRDWMREDRKATSLKTLQGIIWAEGYARGDLHGHVYPDAIAGLRRWHALGIDLYVYSSGSIAAQKLLFAHSSAGDLSPLFRGYFDTTTGPKNDADSYRRIARTIAVSPGAIVFLSDRESELEAAHDAGWQVAFLARPADVPAGTQSKFRAVESFDGLDVARLSP